RGTPARVSRASARQCPVDSGALDPTFGTNGKVQIANAATGSIGSNIVAAAVAMQTTGKTIVAGYNDNSDCVLVRLNVDGSVDTSFGGTNQFSPGFAGFGGCSFAAVAIRPDDRIVAVANQPNGSAVVTQFTANGLPDNSAGIDGATFIAAASGDSTYVSHVVLESNGTIDIAGFYHQQSTNNNQFLFVQISADGKTVQPLFQYEFGGQQPGRSRLGSGDRRAGSLCRVRLPPWRERQLRLRCHPHFAESV
ncbi:hypothetical protein ELE36_00005, partial (plasmid) [Pseudolysobacter antarcticus]